MTPRDSLGGARPWEIDRPSGNRKATARKRGIHTKRGKKKLTPTGVSRPLGGETSEKPDAFGFSLKRNTNQRTMHRDDPNPRHIS